MKNILVSTAVAAVLGTASFGANASGIADGDTLEIAAGGSAVVSCVFGTPIDPATGECPNPAGNVTGQVGSFFQLGGGTTNLTNNQGVILGATQLASGSHAGAPNGTESPSIDVPWEFSSNTGMHQSVSPITVISQTELDFAGWNVTWNGIPSIAMGGCQGGDPANNGGFSGCDTDQDGVDDNFNTGIATVTITGDTYVLDYFANVPAGDPSGFGGAGYTLRLEGAIVHAVPVPAAVWLFGSGLLGLAGIARRKKAA
ncbi:hypothetical protein MNBD_GAMMA11-773 [hydrothermal vent metagenome]|uniref:PEP-CTERM protein-sorting domain-containing protein n=1 Tax=hydrothermal vent metagenome TaxID=652676 RepID=A0A3B0XRB4_9ZZZZ